MSVLGEDPYNNYPALSSPLLGKASCMQLRPRGSCISGLTQHIPMG